jgi:hypothetical protein
LEAARIDRATDFCLFMAIDVFALLEASGKTFDWRRKNGCRFKDETRAPVNRSGNVQEKEAKTTGLRIRAPLRR